jgi:hypothetical protein
MLVQSKDDPISAMLFALKSPESKRQYPPRLKVFMDYVGLDGDIHQQSVLLLKKALEDPKWLENAIISFIQFQMRVARNEIVPTTISNYIKSLKIFLEMNDFLAGVDWRKIKRGLPLRKDAADDRPPRNRRNKEAGRILRQKNQCYCLDYVIFWYTGRRLGLLELEAR